MLPRVGDNLYVNDVMLIVTHVIWMFERDPEHNRINVYADEVKVKIVSTTSLSVLKDTGEEEPKNVT